MLKNDAEKAMEGLNGKEVEGRNMAVDWALSKDKWEEVKKDEDKDEDKEGKVEEEDSEVKEDAAKGAEDDAATIENEEDDSEDKDEDAMDVDEKEEAPAKPVLPAVEEGSTVFIRNLPFEATEEELRNLWV
jgi:nucleolar protein 4